jgi:16S rRNA C967 or C1407 C5-methylase (RsmB/RsmF family)/NOL1/NOP2/fmu family ribosome biogenesis protein
MGDTLCELCENSAFFAVNGFNLHNMLPAAFLNRVTSQKYIDPMSLLKALEEPSPVSIRINKSKWSKTPEKSEKVPWCNSGYYLKSRPSFTLDPLFHAGCYYPQEASSMFLESAIRQVAGTLENVKVLDLCGAPGGKSTHLSSLLGQSSLLISNEVIRARASVLAETLSKWGSSNVIVTQNDPAAFCKFPGYFDIILVDAPCSGEGMFRTEIAVNEWSADNTLHCSERQKRILTDIWPSLKENGILIYSTCTFNPGENEENLKWLTSRHEAECLVLDISDFRGITEIDFQGIHGYGFYPGKIRGEGFFISVIRKKGHQENAHIKASKRTELRPDKNDLAAAEKYTHFPKDRILKWGDELSSVPCDMDNYVQLFHNLKIVKGGTKLFVVKRNVYLPSHELALSDKLRKDVFIQSEISLKESLAYLRRDNFSLSASMKGWNIVTYKGVNLGFANNIGNRVNNYYPVEWRIRMELPIPGNENIINWSF